MATPQIGLTILIVDDDPRVRELAEFAAGRSRLYGKVLLAENGRHALNILRTCERMPDVILTDLSMPQMDGFELVDALKREPKTKIIPVLMFSSSGILYDQEHALALGCEAFFPKPTSLTALVAIMEEVAAVGLRVGRENTGTQCCS